jgi:hypothetical protein
MKAGAIVLAGVAAAACLAVTGGWAAEAPVASFPSSLDREALLAWLRRDTDITPSQVVAVTPQTLTAVVSAFPAGGGQGPRLVIRAEALTAQTAARTGALSWHVSLNADCDTRRIRMGETTGYPERNLLGERQTLRGAEQAWRAPEPGTALENAWRAACEPAFRGPLMDAGRVEVARTDPPTPKTPPTSAPTPPALAQEPARRAVRPAAAVSRAVVQVGAYASEAEARRALADLGPRLAGREPRVETAEVGGKVWRRALVTGFSDLGEAQRFCERLKATGQNCLARRPR